MAKNDPDYETEEETKLDIPVLDNDFDPDNDPNKVNQVTDDPVYDEADITRTDQITYVPSGADAKCRGIAGQDSENFYIEYI